MFLCGCKYWPFTPRVKHKLRASKSKVLRILFGYMRERRTVVIQTQIYSTVLRTLTKNSYNVYRWNSSTEPAISIMALNTYQNTRHHISEECNSSAHSSMNLKSVSEIGLDGLQIN
jgi:hypothetical protein